MFLNRIDKNHPKGCWVWTGRRHKSGYGKIRVRGKYYATHRYFWIKYFGEIPEGLCVLHKCDNKICVNPDHLFLGTQLENVKDRDNKNRQAKGEEHGSAKLTESLVREIRNLYIKGSKKAGVPALAKKFGMGKWAIYCIVNRKTWRHVS